MKNINKKQYIKMSQKQIRPYLKDREILDAVEYKAIALKKHL